MAKLFTGHESDIEHAWDMLKKAVSTRPILPNNRQELSVALIEEWTRLPQLYFRRLIRSMRRRCRAVIRARGGPTEELLRLFNGQTVNVPPYHSVVFHSVFQGCLTFEAAPT